MSKLSCNIVRDLLPLYCDNVLEAESMIEVEEHLQDCEACRALYEDMEKDIFSKATVVKEKYVPEIKKLLKRVKRKNYVIAGILLVVGVLLFAPLWKIPQDAMIIKEVSLEKVTEKWGQEEEAYSLYVDYEYDFYPGMNMKHTEKGNEIHITGKFSLVGALHGWIDDFTVEGGYGFALKNPDDIHQIYFNGKEIWNIEKDWVQ